MANISIFERFILEALKEGEAYGLELLERVDGAHQGNLYPALRSLENERLVDSYEGPPIAERGDRPRRYYKLTEHGRAQLTELENYYSTGALPSFSVERDPFGALRAIILHIPEGNIAIRAAWDALPAIVIERGGEQMRIQRLPEKSAAEADAKRK